ncbi:5577_t:CDS:2 [Paraglomus occultum]|uniref:non-specific serine/threonine protein kinase n=1 Tax=Paraglomus occultum TaxID=144539 RepID=A0A9N8ZA27_9GLOM|nr:5577_t:CDS:2 [Paraglomus occultum]
MTGRLVCGGNYEVIERIGEGSFGEVFKAAHKVTGVQYAIKRELDDPLYVPQLEHEVSVIRRLEGNDFAPRCHWYGVEGDYHAAVLDLLGPNLKSIKMTFHHLPPRFVIDLALQMIEIIEKVHSYGIVYRDIKPDNFLLEPTFTLPKRQINAEASDDEDAFLKDVPDCSYLFKSDHKVYLVDYGLTDEWRDKETGKHRPIGHTPHKAGTARYSSLNIHRGFIHSRRDDIEALGYVFVDLMKFKLPWTGIQARTSKEGWAKMLEMKTGTSLEELCEGCPRAFMNYIEYARNLRYDEEPDYAYLRKLISSAYGDGPEAELIILSEIPPGLRSRSLSPIHGSPSPTKPRFARAPEDYRLLSPPPSPGSKRGNQFRSRFAYDKCADGSRSRSNSMTITPTGILPPRSKALSPQRTYSLPYSESGNVDAFPTNGNHPNGRENDRRTRRPDAYVPPHREHSNRQGALNIVWRKKDVVKWEDICEKAVADWRNGHSHGDKPNKTRKPLHIGRANGSFADGSINRTRVSKRENVSEEANAKRKDENAGKVDKLDHVNRDNNENTNTSIRNQERGPRSAIRTPSSNSGNHLHEHHDLFKGFDGEQGSNGWINDVEDEGQLLEEVARWGNGKVKIPWIDSQHPHHHHSQHTESQKFHTMPSGNREFFSRRPSVPSPLSIPPDSIPNRAIQSARDYSSARGVNSEENQTLTPRRSSPNIREASLAARLFKRSVPNLREVSKPTVIPPPSATIQRTMAHRQEFTPQSLPLPQSAKRISPPNSYNSRTHGGSPTNDQKGTANCETRYSPQDARYTPQDARYSSQDVRSQFQSLRFNTQDARHPNASYYGHNRDNRRRDRAYTIGHAMSGKKSSHPQIPNFNPSPSLPAQVPPQPQPRPMRRQSHQFTRERSNTFTSFTEKINQFNNRVNPTTPTTPKTPKANAAITPQHAHLHTRERSNTFTSSRGTESPRAGRHRPPPLQYIQSNYNTTDRRNGDSHNGY